MRQYRFLGALVGVLFAVCAAPAALAEAPPAPQPLFNLVTPGPRFGSGSSPHSPLLHGGRLYFFGGVVSALVGTDGTSGGTSIVTPVCETSSENPFLQFRTMLGSAGNAFFFTGADCLDEDKGSGPSRVPLLWRSDGTFEGTFPLPSYVAPVEIATRPVLAEDGTWYFEGCTPELGCEPWASDGTPNGTRLLADLKPGPEGSSPEHFVTAGGKSFFLATLEPRRSTLWVAEGGRILSRPLLALSFLVFPTIVEAGDRVLIVDVTDTGTLVWASDGTSGGTVVVARPSGFQGLLPSAGSRGHFESTGQDERTEIWGTDGTAAGTRRLARFDAGGRLDSFDDMAVLGDTLFLIERQSSSHRLWAIRGDFAAPLAAIPAFFDDPLTVAGDRLFFVGHDPLHGAELWASDGTAAGTARVGDFCPGPCDFIASGGLVEIQEGVAFRGRQLGSEEQLWTSDGTAAGTRQRTRLDSAEVQIQRFGSSFWAEVGGRLVFAAGDLQRGAEAWVTDGSSAGASPLADRDFEFGIASLDLTPWRGGVAFVACTEEAYVWWSDPTGELLTGLDGGGTESCNVFQQPSLTMAGDLLFYIDHDGQVNSSDGVPAGARTLTSFSLGSSPPYFEGSALYPVEGRALFIVRSSHQPPTQELWASDGTPEGTGKAVSFPAGTQLTGLGIADGELLLSVFRGRSQLVASDGSPAGTRTIAEPGLGLLATPPFMRAGGRTYFFVAGETSREYDLWVTGGTAGSTRKLADLPPSHIDFGVGFGGVADGVVLFAAPTPDGLGRQLWRSDGTRAGTAPIAAIAPDFGLFGSAPALFAGRLWFRASDGVHGSELWASDGTGAGTVLVKDIVPGLGSSAPGDFEVARGRLFFAASDRAHGRELWVSDGTADDTRLVGDLLPGVLSSAPSELTASGDTLFFGVSDAEVGGELWALPLEAPAPCAPSETALCLAGGRFRVEASWRDFAGNRGSGRARPLTADTGTFWFFDQANVELVVKVLDGRGTNGKFWVFYGALSNVEYTLTVTDTATGQGKIYRNPAGRFASAGDTEAFATASAAQAAPAGATTDRADGAALRRQPAGATAPCEPGPRRLCLNGGRFAVETAWKDFGGHQGAGTALGLTGDTGAFWFFDEANVEVVVKVLDGRVVNDRFWVFYGALTNVEYTLTVTDTATGEVRTYRNPSGRFASAGDTEAF